jgi:drug/metabolite transporter (DMT)-like permease
VAAVALALLAGIAFGGLTVAVRWGLTHCEEPEIGALVSTTLGGLACMVLAVPSGAAKGLHISDLWPFAVAGLIAPGASQIVLTLAVRHAGSARAAIFMGTAPLLSIFIALTVLGEPFRPLVFLGAVLIVIGGIALGREPTRPAYVRALGITLAILCASLFAARDNILRWGAGGEHPPPLVAATTSLVAAAALILGYVLVVRRDKLGTSLSRALPAFAPAGFALAVGYAALLGALDRASVSIVSPLHATGSLWAVLLSATVLGRNSERIGSRTVIAASFVVAGGAIIGAVR